MRLCSPSIDDPFLVVFVRRLVPGHGVPEIGARVAAAFYDRHFRVQVEAADRRDGGSNAQQRQQRSGRRPRHCS